VRFPVTIRHRTSKAKIYAPGGKFAYYRLAYTTAGKRRMQTFAAYSDAKAAAERIVRELANGSQAAALIHADEIVIEVRKIRKSPRDSFKDDVKLFGSRGKSRPPTIS
jgi:glyoxylate carboligase